MRIKLNRLSVMAGTVFVSAVVIMTAACSGGESRESVDLSEADETFTPILSISESGAEIGQGFGTLADASIESPFDAQEMSKRGLDYYMEADGIPRGRGAEELLDVRVATGLYSGMRFGNGEWAYIDTPVWAVAVHNLPYSIPCGGGGSTVCNEPSGRYTVVFDALTGEAISSELFGGGPRSRDWQGIDLTPR